MSKALADCLRYNRWANLALIDACRGLTAEQLDTRATRSSRSARDLLSHVVGSELTFALRTKGRQNEGESRHVDTWPGFEVLREVAASSGDHLVQKRGSPVVSGVGASPTVAGVRMASYGEAHDANASANRFRVRRASR